MSRRSAVREMTVEEWDRVMDSNMRGLSSRAGRRRGARRPGRPPEDHHDLPGRADASGRVGASHYCAWKPGVVMFTRVLAQALPAQSINVNWHRPPGRGRRMAREGRPRRGPPASRPGVGRAHNPGRWFKSSYALSCSQKVIPIARNRSRAAATAATAASESPHRRCRRPSPTWQCAWSGRMSSWLARARAFW